MRNMIQIDKNKLASLLRNKNLSEISRRIGYSSNYITNAIGTNDKSGKMSKAAVTTLELLYGIKYEDYKPDDEVKEIAEEKETVKEVLVTDLTKDELYDLIYTAVYKAVQKAWRE